MDKRQRNYRLLIDLEEQSFKSFTGVTPPSSNGPKLEIDPPFSLDFDIVRNTLASANSATFRVTNLSENTRKKIFKDKYATDVYKGIEFKAGYLEQIPTLFKGNIRQAYSVREGTQYITTIDCQDGGFAFVNGEANMTFPKGTRNEDILASIMATLPNVQTGVIGAFPGSTTRGNTYSGNSANLLQELSGNAFYVDLEKGYILGDSETIQGNIAVIQSDTGLLGTPRREETNLTFDILFEPRLLIGQIVQLISITEKNFNGFYKVMSVHHRGTISDAVSGTAVTTVGLWYGPQLLKVVGQ